MDIEKFLDSEDIDKFLDSELRKRVGGYLGCAVCMFWIIASILYLMIPASLNALNYDVASAMPVWMISLYSQAGTLILVLLGWIILNVVQEIGDILDYYHIGG